MNYLLKTLLIFTLSILSPLYAHDSEEESLKNLMLQKSDAFFAILNDKGLKDEERKTKVLAEIEPIFDFRLMSRLSLRKQIWKSISKEQRKEFSSVFVSNIKASYLDKLDVFSDTKVEIQEAIRVKKSRIEVSAEILTKTDSKKIIYKFYPNKRRGWLIYDISIVGVSFLQSYRVQYSSYLKEHTFEELLEKLKTKNLPKENG